MTLSIFCTDESAPIPRPVTLRLTCDRDHGLFGRPTDEEPCDPWYPDARRRLERRGWKISDSGGEDLCPQCSGRVVV